MACSTGTIACPAHVHSTTRQVLDEQIDQEKLVRQFRKGLTSHLEELGLGKSGLAAVFEEMDTTGRGELTIKELSNVLFKLNYHGSKVTDKKKMARCT